MWPYLRRASLIIGALLIVSAFRAAKPVCHTEPGVPQTAGGSTPPATTTAGDRPDFTVGFGTEVEEEMCVMDIRLPAVFAVAGVAAIGAAAMYHSNPR